MVNMNKKIPHTAERKKFNGMDIGKGSFPNEIEMPTIIDIPRVEERNADVCRNDNHFKETPIVGVPSSSEQGKDEQNENPLSRQKNSTASSPVFDLSKKIRRYIHEVTGEELRRTVDIEDLKELKKALKKAITNAENFWFEDTTDSPLVITDKLRGEINSLFGEAFKDE